VRLLTRLAVVSLVVAQLAGCSSCLRDEDDQQQQQQNAVNTKPMAHQAPLTGKYRFQLHPADASTED
jgi:hypothetical protein